MSVILGITFFLALHPSLSSCIASPLVVLPVPLHGAEIRWIPRDCPPPVSNSVLRHHRLIVAFWLVAWIVVFLCRFTHPAFCLVLLKIMDPTTLPFVSSHSLKMTSHMVDINSDVADLDQLLQSYMLAANAPSPDACLTDSKPSSTSSGSSGQPGLVRSANEVDNTFACAIVAAVMAALQASTKPSTMKSPSSYSSSEVLVNINNMQLCDTPCSATELLMGQVLVLYTSCSLTAEAKKKICEHC